MSLEKYSKRFCKLTGSDLLVIYTRVNGQHALFDDRDAIVIATLLEEHKKNSPSNKLTLLLHSQGGDIIQAIKIANILQSQYPQIDSIVYNIAKSSLSLISLCGANLFLHSDGGISDFSLNMNEKLSFDEFNKINIAMIHILKKGVVKSEVSKGNTNALINAVETFVIPAKVHGTTISLHELSKSFPHSISDVNSYPHTQFHLSSIHKLLLHEFKEKPGLYKIIGLNGKYTGV